MKFIAILPVRQEPEGEVATHALMFAAQRAKKLIDDHMIRTVIEGELP